MLLPVAVFCVWAGEGWFLALVIASSAGIAVEWAGLCRAPVLAWPGMVLPAGLVLAAVCAGTGREGTALAILVAGWAACGWYGGRVMPREDQAAAGKDMTREEMFFSRHTLAFGFPYLAPAAIALAWVRADPAAGFANTLFMLTIVWGSDIGAYVTGRLIGGPKLAPTISPGKTRSGAVGGLVTAALAGLGVASCVSGDFSPPRVIVIALCLGVAAQAGDLFESALKRDFGVKDSGRIIPGHGGLLDRLDALLAVAPIAALLAFTVGRGVVLWR